MQSDLGSSQFWGISEGSPSAGCENTVPSQWFFRIKRFQTGVAQFFATHSVLLLSCMIQFSQSWKEHNGRSARALLHNKVCKLHSEYSSKRSAQFTLSNYLIKERFRYLNDTTRFRLNFLNGCQSSRFNLTQKFFSYRTLLLESPDETSDSQEFLN
jgi:hypothetical protein